MLVVAFFDRAISQQNLIAAKPGKWEKNGENRHYNTQNPIVVFCEKLDDDHGTEKATDLCNQKRQKNVMPFVFEKITQKFFQAVHAICFGKTWR